MRYYGPGRPKKEPDDLITVEQAVEKIKEHLGQKYGAAVAERLSLARGTIYNKISMGQLHKWKKHNGRVLLSEREVLKLVS